MKTSDGDKSSGEKIVPQLVGTTRVKSLDANVIFFGAPLDIRSQRNATAPNGLCA